MGTRKLSFQKVNSSRWFALFSSNLRVGAGFALGASTNGGNIQGDGTIPQAHSLLYRVF